jgi:hypothetical protein
LDTFVFWHAPALQASVVHAFPSTQLVHAAPAEPHWAVLSKPRATHAPPFEQPVQQVPV